MCMIDSCFVFQLICSFVFLSLWKKNKSSLFLFLMQKRMAVELFDVISIWLFTAKKASNCEKHKPVGDSLDDIHCSKFQSYTLTQTTFEMTQFKMPHGTYDPLWIISRLNTETVPSVLKRLQFMQNKFKIYTPHTFIHTPNMFGQLLVLNVILLDLMITPTPYTIDSYPFKCQ